ncbi:centromere protein F-like isoform X3 [Crassostrea angulata]|uniref:centromere protein F-like isoform X3 n=1 Tax=Magallana angulata TaxID=2784310 RepID=UPI0022B13737|nr:centromere protein F-like isoform X3 [Crassostrea angulata]
MSAPRRNQKQPLTIQNKGGNRQSGAGGGTHIPVPSSSKKNPGKNDLPQKTGAKTASPSPVQTGSSSKTKAGRNDFPQKTGAKTASPSPAQTGRPLPIPPQEKKKKILQVVNDTFASNNDSDQELEAAENQTEDILRELQTLAQELNITDSSPQEIIEAACREIRNSKETNTKDYNKGKAKESEKLKTATIQDHHSCKEELTVIKTAVMNSNKSKDFKPTQSKEEVVERINTLHSSLEELTVIKTAVMNPNKSKNIKPTQSANEVIDRIHILHGIEQECLGLKEIVFNKEILKLASFDKPDEKERTLENANKIAEELTSLCKKMKTDQKKIFEEVLGKSEQPTMEEVLKAVQSLKKTANESKTEIQQQKTTLEKMEKEITELKGQLKDAENKHQMLLKRSQEREQKLTDEINEVKSQKEKALTRLSEVAGAKLTESNPYITDLSDPNRPEKIGEQFSELYDNLWTDVFEKLSGTCKLSERDSIQTLLQILEDSYGYCKDISSKRYSNTLAELTLWKFVEPNETPSQKKEMKNTQKKKKGADTKETTVNITLDELQKLQTLLVSPSSSSPADSKAVDSILAKIGLNVTNLSNIKKMLKSSLEGTSVIVQESFWKQRSEDPNGQKEVLKCTKPFLMKCVHICWLMVGQDPPVYLRFSDKCKDKFNKDIYREYTTNGEVLDFVVWPAIFLHENGPLLKKGVAQPISKK